MVARNYTEVAWRGNDTPADLHIKMSATLGNVDTYSYYPGYCGWYPYYYCYPSWSYEGSYNFGSLVLTMGDVKNAAPGGGGKLPHLDVVGARSPLRLLHAGRPVGGANVNWARIRSRSIGPSPIPPTSRGLRSARRTP